MNENHMALLNFAETFAEAVANGTKRTTIRKQRKYPVRAGETLHLYTGCRTSHARRLGEVVCSTTTPIEISRVQNGRHWSLRVRMGGQWLDVGSIRKLYERDGFHDRESFMNWFLPGRTTKFKGQLIEW